MRNKYNVKNSDNSREVDPPIASGAESNQCSADGKDFY